ncbi:MAG TPA: pyridoxal phosphate-dependent aminotransferase [Blastocatellia bacterium]|nr:pyridoxal phosphate-dependent aminotransferase [Blastocatellia bacterium]
MFSARFKWTLTTNRLALLLAEKKKAGAPILDLTESNPTRAGFEYPVAEILAALADPRAMTYEPTPQGLVSARRAVADYYRARGETVAPEHIHLTASTSEAYGWLFKLLADGGDNVLVPQPSYPLFDFLAALEGVELRPYELAYVHPVGWRIDFDSLCRAVTPRTRAVIVVSPNNPTGSFIKSHELDELTGICAASGLALVVDEVFADYAFGPDVARAAPLTSVSSALTFVMNGFSKTLGLPQMKLGWIITGGPEDLRREALERQELIADTFLSVNTPVQHAVPAWLQLREPIQSQIIARARANLEYLSGLVEDSPCRLLEVEGGWSATLEVPRHFSEEEWALRLLEEDDVLVHPGYFFDFEREAFLVLSLLPRPEIFQEAAGRLLARVVGGVQSP